jgi:hypothetical protein
VTEALPESALLSVLHNQGLLDSSLSHTVDKGARRTPARLSPSLFADRRVSPDQDTGVLTGSFHHGAGLLSVLDQHGLLDATRQSASGGQ